MDMLKDMHWYNMLMKIKPKMLYKKWIIKKYIKNKLKLIGPLEKSLLKIKKQSDSLIERWIYIWLKNICDVIVLIIHC